MPKPKPPKPPLSADQERLLWKIEHEPNSVTATYACSVVDGPINAHRAREPRTDALAQLIYKALGEDKVTTAEVLQVLKREEHQGVIEGVVDGVIEWTDKSGRCRETPVEALAKRVSRARQQLKNSR